MNTVEKITASSGNVFTDLGFDDAEAANLQLRSRLIAELKSVSGKKRHDQ